MNECTLIIKDEVNIQITGLDAETRRKIVNKLKFTIPNARHIPSVKLGRWDGTKTFFSIGGTGFLAHLDIILPIIDSANYIVNVIDERIPMQINFNEITRDYWAAKGKTWPVGHVYAGQALELRDDQEEAVNVFLRNPQAVQELCTSFGKTIVTATLSHICEKYGRTIVIVPSTTLVLQTEEDYINLGLDVGVYYGGRKELNKTHTICTWQSLNVLDKKSNSDEAITISSFLKDVICVIGDECHTVGADVLTKLFTKNLKNCPIRWGFTGTIPKAPIEFNGLISSIGHIVNKVSAYELQEQGILSTVNINILQTTDVRQFQNFANEYTFLTTDIERLRWLGQQIVKISATGNTLVLVNRIETGKILSKLIPDSIFISGSASQKARKSEYEDVKTADNKILIATFGIMSTGVSIVRLHNLVIVEAGKSFTRTIQSIGRVLRKGFDKNHAEIWDICSSCKYSKKHLTERKSYYREAKYPFTITKIKSYT
jgi:superfamily II DNA or RNA helicase